MRDYFRPIVRSGPMPGAGAVPLAGGPLWFEQAERLRRGAAPVPVALDKIPQDWLARLSAARAPIAQMAWDRPQVMGILNVTPDSFSDGGDFDAPQQALAQARRMIADGADVLDIGGESTRPGAEVVPVAEEIARVRPVIESLRAEGLGPISVDTRNSATAAAAQAAGAVLFNDVSALEHDPQSAAVAARLGLAVCLMHAQGDPKTMQADPQYDDVLLDVYDYLAARVAAAEEAGVPRGQILADPGIGFGKTVAHNLALLQGLALFHGLGVPLLVGASRKRFIGSLGAAPEPKDRLGGSVAVAVLAAAQGAQVLRVHDVRETAQALKLARAVAFGA